MKLYFVAAENDGMNQDLFVIANTYEEAVGYWRMYYEGDMQPPDKVFDAPTDVHHTGAVPWNQVNCVWKKN